MWENARRNILDLRYSLVILTTSPLADRCRRTLVSHHHRKVLEFPVKIVSAFRRPPLSRYIRYSVLPFSRPPFLTPVLAKSWHILPRVSKLQLPPNNINPALTTRSGSHHVASNTAQYHSPWVSECRTSMRPPSPPGPHRKILQAALKGSSRCRSLWRRRRISRPSCPPWALCSTRYVESCGRLDDSWRIS